MPENFIQDTQGAYQFYFPVLFIFMVCAFIMKRVHVKMKPGVLIDSLGRRSPPLHYGGVSVGSISMAIISDRKSRSFQPPFTSRRWARLVSRSFLLVDSRGYPSLLLYFRGAPVGIASQVLPSPRLTQSPLHSTIP